MNNQSIEDILINGVIERLGDSKHIKKTIKAIIDNEVSNLKTSLNDWRGNVQTEINRIASDVEKTLKNSSTSKEIIIIKENSKLEEKKQESLGLQHNKFPQLLDLIQHGEPVYVFGPTGSGKTWATEKVASILDIPFYRKVVHEQMTESALFGYKDATGNFQEGIAYKAYKNGGLLLIDEFDNGNPNINAALKMLIDTKHCEFQNGTIHKHPNFRIVANANTIGSGATKEYVGRNAQDLAALNVFGFLEWPYDLEFEKAIAMAEYKNAGGDNNKLIILIIESFQKCRECAAELQLRRVALSPRNLAAIARMAARKRPPQEIEDAYIYRGMDESQKTKLKTLLKTKVKESICYPAIDEKDAEMDCPIK